MNRHTHPLAPHWRGRGEPRWLVRRAALGLLGGLALVACDEASESTGTAGEPADSAKAEAHAGKDKNCCVGKNDCKGKGGCRTAEHACAGKNDCKGKGGCSHRDCS